MAKRRQIQPFSLDWSVAWFNTLLFSRTDWFLTRTTLSVKVTQNSTCAVTLRVSTAKGYITIDIQSRFAEVCKTPTSTAFQKSAITAHCIFEPHETCYSTPESGWLHGHSSWFLLHSVIHLGFYYCEVIFLVMWPETAPTQQRPKPFDAVSCVFLSFIQRQLVSMMSSLIRFLNKLVQAMKVVYYFCSMCWSN
jgi:hypothetical protein